MDSPPFVRRLSDEDAQKVVNGEMRAQISTGEFLETVHFWDDKLNGKPVKSLVGSVGGRTFSWPACGCGVRTLIRAVPL